MKRIMQRSFFMLIIALLFFGGVCFSGYKVAANSGSWVQHSLNMYLPSNGNFSGAGSILDRKGEVLAYTDSSGHRQYNQDESVRRALLHVVGDNSLSISTAIQSMFRADLSGYNFILGMGRPDSLRADDINLTVDAQACKAAYEALGDHKGACVVYNYKTGEVLCSTSRNSYDPADPPEITPENEKEYDGVYLDNVVSSSFTPGSTFKIVTAASAIENIPDIYTRSFTCTGEYEVLGNKITCEEAHGDLSFEDAFTNSCNCAFAQIAIELGDAKLKRTAEECGFNHKGFTMSGIPLAMSYYDASGAGDNYLAWSGIGQYKDLANPMHMAMICGAIASSGTAVSPFIVQDDGNLLGKLGIDVNKAGNVNMLTSEVADKTKQLMRAAANSYYNNRGVDMAGLNFCAKTGTAEVGKDKEPTAWVVGFTEDDRHPYAFAAVVMEGGYGISAATPVVQAAIEQLVYGN